MQNSEISVIVQGPILGEPWLAADQKITDRVLRNLRRVLPGAHVIVSTWAGANVTGLDFDELVLSEDPGNVPLHVENGRVTVSNNVSRQIVSSLAGLRAAKTPFAMKIRSDIWLEDAAFLAFFGRFSARDDRYGFLSEKVLTSAFHSRMAHNRTAYNPFCFHPGDWFYFGRTADLIDVWDLPLMTMDEGRWFETRPKPPQFRDWLGHIGRFVPENYIWSRFLAKHLPLDYDSYLETSAELCELSDRTIAANLVLLDLDQLRIKSLKYPDLDWKLGFRNATGRFTHRTWLSLYQRYADPTVRLPLVDRAHWGWAFRFVKNALVYSFGKVRRRTIRAARAWLDVD